MKIIKMIKGMTVINGKQYAVGDGAFQIDDEAKAARLVKLGVAEYADGAKVSDIANGSEKVSDDVEDEKDVDSMTYEELKAKASELGIKYPGKKKAELIEEIKAALAGGNDEGDNDASALTGGNDEDDSDAPTFDPTGSIQ